MNTVFVTTHLGNLVILPSVKSEGFVSTFDNRVRIVVRLLQGLSYCFLSYKDMGAVRKVATQKSFCRAL